MQVCRGFSYTRSSPIGKTDKTFIIKISFSRDILSRNLHQKQMPILILRIQNAEEHLKSPSEESVKIFDFRKIPYTHTRTYRLSFRSASYSYSIIYPDEKFARGYIQVQVAESNFTVLFLIAYFIVIMLTIMLMFSMCVILAAKIFRLYFVSFPIF